MRRLEQLRKKRGLSRAELARQVDASAGYVFYLERGLAGPPKNRTRVIERAAALFGVSQCELFDEVSDEVAQQQ